MLAPDLTCGVSCLPAPAAPCTRSLSETVSEASYMKEAMDIMPETLEYGILNSNILHFLRDIICQVRVGGEEPACLRWRPRSLREQAARSSWSGPSWALSLRLCL